MDKKFYRVSEVAQILSLGKSLTYRLVAEGEIPSVWLAGCRARRIPCEALEQWIAKQMRVDDQEPQAAGGSHQRSRVAGSW